MNKEYTAIIDQIGRTIIGVKQEETDTHLTLDNPVIVHVQVTEGGQFSVNTYPLFFFEFLDKETRDANAWTYCKSAITTSNVTLDANVIKQYEGLNTPPPAKEEVPSNPKVVSINDL